MHVEEGAGSFWKWRGHDIYAEEIHPASDSRAPKPAVILLHGFAASTVYWRATIAALANAGYDVHVIDLLGQGRSSKPVPCEEGGAARDGAGFATEGAPAVEFGRNTDAKVNYSIDLWAALVDDYARDRNLGDAVLMGNSLGSLVALAVATGDFVRSDRESGSAYLAGDDVEGGERTSRVKGLCLFNCGVGLNSRNIVKNFNAGDVRRALFNRLFDVLNFLIFDNALLLRYVLDKVVTKELLRETLVGLYPHSPDRVDQQLVDSFYYPAKTGGEGAIEAIRQIYTNDAGITPMEYHARYPDLLDELPMHLIWGLDDAVTPLAGDVGSFYRDRVANNRSGRGNTSIDVISGGHVPFDDNPDEAHRSMLRWLDRKVLK